MATKKKKSNAGRKVLLGATAIVAAAGMAALASNKKVRAKVARGAKTAVRKAKADPRVKKAGKDASGLLAKLSQKVGDWLK